jgi:hypothetical protein
MNTSGLMHETQQTAFRSASLIVATIISCLAVAFVSLHATYPLTGATLKFLGYVLIFNLLPGLVIARLILPEAKEPGVYLIFSLGFGIAINALTVTVLWSVGQLLFLFMLPAVAGGFLVTGFHRLRLSDFFTTRSSVSHWFLATLFLCFTALLGMGFIQSGDPGDAFSEHAAFQGIIIRGLEFGRPPPNLLLPEVAWSYNYLAHLWVLGVKLTTGLSIDVLVTSYGPVALGGTSAAVMLAFGRYAVGLAWWIAALPVICVFWVIGIPPISGGLFASFMPFGGNLILSPFVAILMFFLILAFVLQERSAKARNLLVRIPTLIILMFLATGARGVCPPILLCALALRLVIWSWLDRRLLWQKIIDLIAGIVGFAVGLYFFFTVGSGFSGTGALKFTGQPFTFLTDPNQPLLTLPHTLMRWGLPALPAGIAAFAVIAIFQASFLTPALPMSFIEIRKRAREIDVLLLGAAISGIAGFFLTEAPGYSHVSFLYFSNISMSLLGAWGLQGMISGLHRKSLRDGGLEWGAILAISILVCLHLAELPTKTVAWLGSRWSASALGLVDFSTEAIPRVAPCMRDQDADLYARAGRASPAAVVIVIPAVGLRNCGPFWWIVRFPIQSISDFALHYIPGKATLSTLQEVLSTQQRHMFHAIASAARGVLDVDDITAMAKTVSEARPVFVMAPRVLSVQADSTLQMVDTNESFALWQIFVARHDQTIAHPVP